jgi:hypothetical protein
MRWLASQRSLVLPAPLKRRTGRQSRAGRFRVHKNFFPLPGTESQFRGRPSRSLVPITTTSLRPLPCYCMQNTQPTFYVLLTVHFGIILISNQLDAQFLFLICSILYMFRENPCTSSGESIVSIQHLVYAGMQVRKELSSFLTCIPDGHLYRVTYTRRCIDTIDSPDDEHGVARNM